MYLEFHGNLHFTMILKTDENSQFDPSTFNSQWLSKTVNFITNAGFDRNPRFPIRILFFSY